MAEDRREQELRAAAKQLAGVQRQHRPDQTAAARSQAGQKAQPQRAAQQATTQTATARSQAGQKAQPQRTAQQATTQTANSNGSGKALSGQQIQQMRTTNTPAKESMSQTKQIQHQLEQEVADIMDAESFADLVFIDPDPLPETSKKEEGRTGFFAKRNKETDAATKAQAQKDISEDGYWGVKQTSQRLFDFACALAGDDVDKMKEMQAAVEKGFKQATGAWGRELPSICKDTFDATNKLFDDYYASKEEQTE